MDIEQAIVQAREEAKEREFTQSVDLIINLRDLDLNQTENRFSAKVKLPVNPGESKVCVIGDTLSQDGAEMKLDSSQLEELAEDKKQAKELAENYDFFIAEAPLMPDIGKALGSVLGPRGKMPDPVPVGEDISDKISDLKRSVKVEVKERPSLKLKVGSEDMEDQKLADNVRAVLNLVKEELPQGRRNLDKVLVKLTMGPPLTID